MIENQVLIVQHEQILQLGVTPHTCVKWIKSSFLMKYDAQLSPKISLHPQGNDFFNTMPALLPSKIGRFAVKEVRRIAGQVPSLASDILLYDSRTGQLLAMLDGDWITTMRTGAVASLAIQLFKKSHTDTYSIMGLGNTARAVALCLLDSRNITAPEHVTFRLLKYKNQADLFIKRFEAFENVSFEVVDDIDELIRHADVLISCVTSATELFCTNSEYFKPGMLLIPVHTRGFQNCDLFFDKVFGDDKGHIQDFKYFNQFKHFEELSRVLLGQAPGRQTDDERILCYNIGIGLHDALYASHLYDMILERNINCKSFIQHKLDDKFWL